MGEFVSRRGWFLIHAALIIGASASMYLIKPELWLVGFTFGAMCLMYVWMWLLGKAGQKVDTAVARRRGLTSEQYEASKPAFRFDLGGWPFERQVEGQRREYNGWIVIGGLSCAYAVGKYLLDIAR
jgi:hypothetical protein